MANETKFRGNMTVTGQSNSPVYTVTYAASLTLNFNNGPKQAITMTGSPEFQAPTNVKDGARYVVYLIQDGTGGHSPTFADSSWKWENAVWPTFSSGANDVDIMFIEVKGTELHCWLRKNFDDYTPA